MISAENPPQLLNGNDDHQMLIFSSLRGCGQREEIYYGSSPINTFSKIAL
ncbi:hypothetical protein Rin_00005050 [Candidatus Regiella insecticola 5.15]|uniref:Uncharacterized protein n=1 Tax=Candidatus Regiella insecticola 5.15 TaxID=1005043 RepID=G2GXL2_9ENTR|nr:hypothetical protein Rin_00005050 [Candidatus Regiella insecticola 5.15]